MLAVSNAETSGSSGGLLGTHTRRTAGLNSTEHCNMGIYERFDKLQELLQVEDMPERPGWTKMMQTGNIGLYDYGRGFLCLGVYLWPTHPPYPAGLDASRTYSVRMYLATVDDGDWGGWSAPLSISKGMKVVQDLKEQFKDMVALPTETEFNRIIQPFGLYCTTE